LTNTNEISINPQLIPTLCLFSLASLSLSLSLTADSANNNNQQQAKSSDQSGNQSGARTTAAAAGTGGGGGVSLAANNKDLICRRSLTMQRTLGLWRSNKPESSANEPGSAATGGLSLPTFNANPFDCGQVGVGTSAATSRVFANGPCASSIAPNSGLSSDGRPPSPTTSATLPAPQRKKSLKMCAACSGAHGVDSDTGAPVLGCAAGCALGACACTATSSCVGANDSVIAVPGSAIGLNDPNTAIGSACGGQRIANNLPLRQTRIEQLPDELLLLIFSYVLEIDLARASQVCRRFRTIADDCELWKRLYQQVFQYDLPLFRREVCRFEFANLAECDLVNPWKESMKRLYRGHHVRPSYATEVAANPERYSGRNLRYFTSIENAVAFIENEYEPPTHIELERDRVPAIFIHAGHYRPKMLVIECNVALIGAGKLSIEIKPGSLADILI
jgi:hypothetical protein